MLKLLRYGIVLAAVALWLGLLARQLLPGRYEAAVMTANSVVFVVLLTTLLLPDMIRKRPLAVMAFFASLLAIWIDVRFTCGAQVRFEYNNTTVFWWYAVAYLALPLYERWKVIRSPAVKKGTALTAILAAAGITLTALLTLADFVLRHWHALMAKWDLILVILYLPLMGLAFAAYAWWSRRVKAKP